MLNDQRAATGVMQGKHWREKSRQRQRAPLTVNSKPG